MRAESTVTNGCSNSSSIARSTSSTSCSKRILFFPQVTADADFEARGEWLRCSRPLRGLHDDVGLCPISGRQIEGADLWSYDYGTATGFGFNEAAFQQVAFDEFVI